MANVQWEVHRRESYAGGAPFGDLGPFEIMEGRARYQVDPDDPRNAAIIDLALAPRDRAGAVHFAGDFTLIAPQQTPSTKLLVDVPNRGRRLAFSQFNRAPPGELRDDPCAPGDGFLFRHGFALASIGWQWDIAEGLVLDAPEANRNDRAIEGDVVCRVQPGSDRPFVSFGQFGQVAYPPAGLDDPNARLFVRDHDNAPLAEIPRGRWRFARSRGGDLERSGKFIHLDDGFEKGRIYTLVYRSRGVRVTGCGLLALRDAAASLRRGEGPNGTGFNHVFAFGASQTGRALRHLLHLGLNADDAGNQVFDGVHIHIAGGQRGDFNHRFAQPSSAGAPAAGQQFPFAGTTTRDALTARTDGLYGRLAGSPWMPKVVITNTSWEYWRGDAALTHVASDGTCDLDGHPNERNYLFAGTHHVGGVWPPTDTFAVTGEKARFEFNVVDHGPLTRAAFLNLAAWVEHGTAPPPSTVPTLADGSLVSRSEVLVKFTRVLGQAILDPECLGGLAVLDLGDDEAIGVLRFPAEEGAPYARLVADVDETLNERAGIRLPDVAVPIGCHTGWNPRHPDHGAPHLPAIFVGFSRFNNDLPPEGGYEQDVRSCARALVDSRLLLPDDYERVVGNAMTRYRYAATRAGVTSSVAGFADGPPREGRRGDD